MIIEVQNVHRSFRSVKKEEGFKGAMGLLMRPQYQTHDALKGVSFSLEAGSFNGLIGANGAGKTTLLKILSGLIPPSSGEVRVMGYLPFKRALEFRKQIALVMGQKAQLWWDLPAVDAFELLKAIYEIPNLLYRERLEHLTTILDVKAHLHTQIRRLSLGERMKMELIGAIIHWPSVIFLDEPTIGLDVFAAHKLREFLRIFNQDEKATIILTSHNMEDIERLCSRMLILREGKMIYDGAPSGLMKKGERQLKVRFFETPTLEELHQVTGLPRTTVPVIQEEFTGGEARSYCFELKQDQMASVLQKLIGRFQIIDMGIEEQSLESVIQRLFEEDHTERSAQNVPSTDKTGLNA